MDALQLCRENAFEAAFPGTPRVVQVIVARCALLMQVLLDRRFSLQEYENLTY